MKILNKIQESIYPPNDKNLLWLDINDCNKAVLKYHHNCKWIKISDESFLIDALKVLVDKNTEDIKKEKDEREKVDDFIYKLIGSDVYINGTGVQGLETEVKTNLIGALNKIDETIGRLSNLDIDIKTEDNSPNNIISALNILKKLLDDEITRAKSVEGNLDDLDTTNNTNLVEAINELKSDLSTVYRIKGSSKLDALPTGDNVKVGDVYNITDSGTIDINGETIVILPGDNVVYTDNGWDKLNASIDTSLYQEKLTTSNEGYGIKITPDDTDSKLTTIAVNIPNYKNEPYETTQTEEGVKVTTIEEKINTKQDKLTDGDYISIDDNNISCTLIAGDNITITPDDNGKYEINTKYTSVSSSDGTVTINQTNDNYDLSIKDKLDTKQDKLTAGDGISIDNNVISNMFELSSDDDSVKLGSSKTFGYDLSIPFKIKSNTEDNSNVLALNSFKLPLATSFKIETKDIDIIFTLTNCKVYNKDTDSCCTTWEITATDNSKIPPIYLSEGGILVDRVVNNDEDNLGFSIYTPDTNIYIDSIKEYTAISYINTNDNVFNFKDCGDDFIADFKANNKVCVPNKFSTNVPYFEVVSNDITITKQLALKDDLLDYKKHIDTEIKEKLTKVYKIKGSVAQFAGLPTNAEIGDVYNVSEEFVYHEPNTVTRTTNIGWNGNPLKAEITINIELSKSSEYYKIIVFVAQDSPFMLRDFGNSNIKYSYNKTNKEINPANYNTEEFPEVKKKTGLNNNKQLELWIKADDEFSLPKTFWIEIIDDYAVDAVNEASLNWVSESGKTYPANTNFVWTGEEWDSLGGMFDFKEIEDTPLEEKDIIKIFTNNQIPIE